MTISRRKPGALGCHVEGFHRYLQGLGYTPGTIQNQLTLFGHVGRWMETRGLSPQDLTTAVIDEFIAEARQQGRLHRADRRTAFQVFEHLAEQGVAPAPSADPATSLERFLDEYQDWMLHERGLAEATVQRYENTARRFLVLRAIADFDPAVGVTSAEVNTFLLAECARCSVGAAKGRVAELRSLLRYLFVRELTATPVGGGGPAGGGLAQHRHPAEPVSRGRTGHAGQLRSGQAEWDPGPAILTLVARLGLRSIEVSRMELDDVNWRTGEITIRGKARRIDTMPLPVEVGAGVGGLSGRCPTLRRPRPTPAVPHRTRSAIPDPRGPGQRRRETSLSPGRTCPGGGASAPACAGPADGGRGRGADRHQPGVASPRPGHHSDLRQGRPRLAADGRQTVARPRLPRWAEQDDDRAR